MRLPGNFLPKHPFDHGNIEGRDERLWPWPRTPEIVRPELAAYYAVVAHMDEQVGRIVAALRDTGQAEQTIVIFASDQGLAIGSHGLRGKQNMYEHTVRTPLVLAGPGVPQGASVAAQCYLRDLYPTVCDLVGIAVPEQVQGRSVAPVIRGERQEIYPHVFCYFGDVQRMIRTDRWKLIQYPKIAREQLFDIQCDPEERNDLISEPQHAEVLSKLRRQLAEEIAAH
jgi:arylsulfatase A-like enzyme